MSADIISGLQITVLGFTMVIIALVLLYLIILGLSRILNPQAVMKKSVDTEIEEKKMDFEGEKSDTPRSDSKDEGLDNTTVAVISASISMMLDAGETGFRIRNIKPIKRNEESSFWTISGREDLMKPHHETN